MIYTSSHKNYRSKYFKTISISGNRGKDANYEGDCFPLLAPKLSFWTIWHNNLGIIPELENNTYYIEEYYKQVLSSLNPQEVYKQLNNSILLCYENNNEFCHRHIVAEWLEISLGIHIPEVLVEDQVVQELERPAYIKEIILNIMKQSNTEIKSKGLSKKLVV